MDIDPGKAMRLEILRNAAQRELIEMLREHLWEAEVESEVEQGEYLVITAKKAGVVKRIALIYSSATDNALYKQLALRVDIVAYNGHPYLVEQYAHGVNVPVIEIRKFFSELVKWNAEVSPGRFDAVQPEIEPPPFPQSKRQYLLSDNPIEAIWERLNQLKSATLARKAVLARALSQGMFLTEEDVATKGEGIAFAIQNAFDYFGSKSAGNISQRVLSLYYGSMSFAMAEMLADPLGPKTLQEAENFTKQGHGLYSFDGASGDIKDLIVGTLRSGFFTKWASSFVGTPLTCVEKKPYTAEQLASQPADSWVTLEQLFARIPEVADLYAMVFEGPGQWLKPVPAGGMGVAQGAGTGVTYVHFIDESGRLETSAIADFPGPISQLMQVQADVGSRMFKGAVSHPGHQFWFQALAMHQSPYRGGVLIRPLFGTVAAYRAIVVVLLYALSILVRYRPSVWRRIQEGDLDHVRALIEAFLGIVERSVPQQFLESITGTPTSAHVPGTWA